MRQRLQGSESRVERKRDTKLGSQKFPSLFIDKLQPAYWLRAFSCAGISPRSFPGLHFWALIPTAPCPPSTLLPLSQANISVKAYGGKLEHHSGEPLHLIWSFVPTSYLKWMRAGPADSDWAHNTEAESQGCLLFINFLVGRPQRPMPSPLMRDWKGLIFGFLPESKPCCDALVYFNLSWNTFHPF